MPVGVALVVLVVWLLAVYIWNRRLFRGPPEGSSGDGRHAGPADVERLDLNRLRRDMALACLYDTPPNELGELPPDPTQLPADAREQREVELTRRVLAGTLDPSSYRQQMRNLAQGKERSSGTP